jgi:hypothetical protein
VYMVCMGLMPLGSLPTGALADRIGTAYAIAIWGLLGTAVLGVVVLSQVIGDRQAQRTPRHQAAVDANVSS